MQVFGVSFDSPKTNAAFAAKNDFKFKLLSDSDRSLALALGLVDSDSAWFAPRTTFIVSPEGIIEEVIETKNVSTQASEILADLASSD
jgi:peroxiredoxin